jgi:hypothetical protein
MLVMLPFSVVDRNCTIRVGSPAVTAITHPRQQNAGEVLHVRQMIRIAAAVILRLVEFEGPRLDCQRHLEKQRRPKPPPLEDQLCSAFSVEPARRG